MNIRLSPTSSYYIRKLVHRFSNNLRSVVAPGAALQPDSLSDLNAVLDSLYLEAEEISAVTRQLENLASVHQALQAQASLFAGSSDQLNRLEQQIFWLLGLKMSIADPVA